MRMVSLLLSFAAGVMVAVVCGDLLAQALTQGQLGLTAAGTLGGFALTARLNGALARRQVPTGKRGGLVLAGVVMGAAIALHNVPEGMVIGAAFAAGGAGEGWLLAAVIALHNVPEGMAVAGPLAAGGERRAKAAGLAAAAGAPTVLGAALGFWLGTLHNVPEGMAVAGPLAAGGERRAKAAGLAAAAGAPTVLGAALGFWLGTMGPGALTAALSLAAGAMLYVVFGELLPEAAELWRGRAPALAAVSGVLVGMWIAG